MKKLLFLVSFITITMCITVFWGQFLSTAEAQEFSFVTISDVHIPGYGFPIGYSLDEKTLMQMHNQQRIQQFVRECLTMDPKPSFVINCGDTGDVGWISLLKLYGKLMNPLVSSGIPVYTVVGNHDLDYAGIASEDLAELFDPLGPALIGRHGTRYSFEYRGCHFVVLNNRPITGLIRLNPEELTWLRNDLKSIRKDTPVLLFLHADMQEEDTFAIVEILQTFKYPAIFRGHRHSSEIEHWGGVPVILTGSLYGGMPKDGSYRIVTVKSGRITVRTRDFAQPPGTLDSEETVDFPLPGPELRIKMPGNKLLAGGTVALQAETKPASSGVIEYSIPGLSDWTAMTGGNGRWKAEAQVPAASGHYLLLLRFRSDDGAVVLKHTVFEIPGDKVRKIWEKDIGSAVMGAPVIRGDLSIIPSVEGGVYALRIKDGKKVWHRKAGKGQIPGRIATEGDVVYYGAGRTVYACNAKTGKPVWEKSLDGSIVAGITAGNGRLFIPAGERKLYCLDARQGKILWDYTAGLPIMMEPATDGKMVFFGAMDGYLRALDAATGKEVWINQISSMEDSYVTAPFWPPVISGGKVIISKIPARKEEMNLVAFSTADGKVLWSRQLSAGTFRLALNLEKDTLYTPCQGGVQCLSAGDGSLVWNQAGGVAMNAACTTENVVLARNTNSISCIDAATGQLKWTYRTSTGPQGSYYGPGAMAVRDNIVILGTLDGKILALKW